MDLRRGFTGLSGRRGDGAGGESLFRSGVRSSFAASAATLLGFFGGVAMGCGYAGEKTGARKIHLVASDERNRVTDTGTAIDTLLKGTIGGVRCAAT